MNIHTCIQRITATNLPNATVVRVVMCIHVYARIYLWMEYKYTYILNIYMHILYDMVVRVVNMYVLI